MTDMEDALMTDTPMTQIYFRAPVELKARVEAAAKGHETVSDYLTAVTERALANADPESSAPAGDPPRLNTLDDAVAVLLTHINREQADLIADLCADNGATPKDYVLAYINLAHERGETATMVGDNLRDDALRPAPTLASPVAGECAFCGKGFVAAKRGQRFCADPDDGTESCGRKATLRDLHAKRPPERQSKQHEIAATRGIR